MATKSNAKGLVVGAPKQAVVIIHGMGQQKPMETLRSMVKVLWETDLDLTDGSTFKETKRMDTTMAEEGHEDPPQPLNQTWIVPDTRTGSMELARITTPTANNGLRTDFFEFYWADIMEGTTRDHLTAWVSGLLLRWPFQVPRDVAVAWLVLWAFTIAGVGFAINGIVSVIGGGNNDASALLFDPSHWAALIMSLVLAGIAWYLWKLYTSQRAGKSALDWLWAFCLPIIVGYLVYWLLPVEVAASPAFGSFLISGAIGLIVRNFLLPYFGDVARYVRAEPDTIAKRAAVRERGLELLRALHEPSEVDDPFINKSLIPKQGRRYERIVVVAHSLGTIVAYDILRHFWAERGPVAGGVQNPESIKALEAVDAYIQKHSTDGVPGTTFDVGAFRKLQRKTSRALALSQDGWLITDFVTLGSPLTHAEFLLARDQQQFDDLVRDGLISTCPPTPDATSNSILYKPKGNRRPIARHTAMFGAVRWTNICDKHRFVLLGDIVSGLLKETMGHGIADFDVKIRKRGLFPSLFTHTSYWDADASSKIGPSGAQSAKYCEQPQPHIELLRDAVALDEPVVNEVEEAQARTLMV